jgi:hypothetical protein
MATGTGSGRWATGLALATVAGLAAASPAAAQQVHAFVMAGVGVQAPAASGFEQSVSFPYRLETATERSVYQIGRGLAIDAGGGVMITRRFGVSAAFSRFSNAQPAAYTLTLPHPLVFNMPTSHSSTTGALTHLETAIHIDGVFDAIAGGPFAVTIFAGPSRVRVTQPVVADVQFTEGFSSDLTYDFTLTGVDTRADTASAWGFNVGGAFLYGIGRNLGLGAFVRLIRARVDVNDPLQTSLAGHAVSTGIDAGGLLVGAAVQVRF